MQVGLGDFDVVSEHLVESDLERRDASSRALIGLDSGDEILASVAKGAKGVQLFIDAGEDDRIFVEANRGFLDDRRKNIGAQVAAIVPLLRDVAQTTAHWCVVERSPNVGH